MKYKALARFCIGALLIASPAIVQSDTIFTDPISSTSASNWVAGLGTNTPTVVNGMLRIGNYSSSPVILKRGESDAHTSFTLSATMKPVKSTGMAGIVCCWKGATYSGYIFSISGRQNIMLHRMYLDSVASMIRTTPLFGGIYATANTSPNKLTISKEGNTLNLYCNDIFIGSVTDAHCSNGGIGFFVSAGDTIDYDNVVWTDSYRSDHSALPFFADNFEDGNMDGWGKWFQRGTSSVSAGVLSITGSDSIYNRLFVEGAFKNKPVQVRMRYVSGGVSKIYGIWLMEVDHTFDVSSGSFNTLSDKFTCFNISGDRYYGVTSGGVWTPVTSEFIHGNGEWDTLLVTGDLKMVINGDTLPLEAFTTFNYNAIALCADKGMTVEFDDFFAGDSTGVPVRNRLVPRSTIQPYSLGAIPPAPAIIIDPLGRVVMKVDNTSLMPNHLSPGYLIVHTRGATGKTLWNGVWMDR